MNIRVKIPTQAFSDFVDRLREDTQVSTPGAYSDGVIAASNEYMTFTRNRFIRASNQDGTWVPLAPMTVAAHTAIGDVPYHILHMFGPLEASLYRDAPGHVMEVSLFSVTEGTDNIRARTHQDGKGKIPARPMFVNPPEDTLELMVGKIAQGLQQAVSGGSTFML